MDRRTLVRTGLGAAVGVGLGVAARPAGAGAVASAQPDLEALRRSLSPAARLLTPGQAEYETVAPPFNRQFSSVRPLAIVMVGILDDIRASVRWAAGNGVPVTPRSNLGHNYAGYSSTTGLLLVMSQLTGVSWYPGEPSERVAYSTGTLHRNAGQLVVEAGVTNGLLHPNLELGNILLPTGRCSSVGVAGLVLGGGIGFSDKMAGLTCDRLTATTIVTADGEWITCDATTNADLFWAVRGGAGDNFGIHFDFTFDYDKYYGTVAYYRFRWSLDSAIPAVSALQRACAEGFSDRRLHMRIGIETSGATSQQVRANSAVTATGQFYGSASELTKLLGAALAVGTVSERSQNAASVRDVTLAEASVLLNEDVAPGPFTGASTVLAAPLSDDESTPSASTCLPGREAPARTGSISPCSPSGER
ncbi:FAD-binding oxidoreductase [Leifsonia xyli]|uniref:FAD-binding oxidoreductase n=1 Tax=Leifsonia xyli TaxID=1575 RepID=UPI003D669E63